MSSYSKNRALGYTGKGHIGTLQSTTDPNDLSLRIGLDYQRNQLNTKNEKSKQNSKRLKQLKENQTKRLSTETED